jgi:hypothetical protein
MTFSHCPEVAGICGTGLSDARIARTMDAFYQSASTPARRPLSVRHQAWLNRGAIRYSAALDFWIPNAVRPFARQSGPLPLRRAGFPFGPVPTGTPQPVFPLSMGPAPNAPGPTAPANRLRLWRVIWAGSGDRGRQASPVLRRAADSGRDLPWRGARNSPARIQIGCGQRLQDWMAGQARLRSVRCSAEAHAIQTMGSVVFRAHRSRRRVRALAPDAERETVLSSGV